MLRISEVWSLLPYLPETKASYSAGLVLFEDGKRKLVVAGGTSRTSYIFDFELEVWTPGKNK